MRHKISHRHFSRTSAHRMAMFANMAASLFLEERIKTTDTKAKELRGVAEKLITAAKKGATLQAEAASAPLEADKKRLMAQAIHKRRVVASFLCNPAAVQKLFGEIQGRFTTRPGGYTRILKIGARLGDAAPLSFIELVERPKVEAEPVKSAKEE